jgi:CrcB protein
MKYLLVFLGGGIGTVLRFSINVAFPRLFGMAFPYHTLFENVSGSFVMGLLAGYFAHKASDPQVSLFLMTGIIGGYTTFSTFSLDTLVLWGRHQYGAAGLYVALSVSASIGGLILGLLIMRAIFGPS